MSKVESNLDALRSILGQIEELSASKKVIDSKISDLRKQEESIRADIFSEMVSAQEKIISIDGVVEVCIRKSPKQFVVKDEVAFSDLASRSGRYDDIFKHEVKMSKVAANKFISELQSCGSVPDFIEVNQGEDSLSITWAKPSLDQPSVKTFKKSASSSEKELLSDLDTI
jgi:hypothetical protein